MSSKNYFRIFYAVAAVILIGNILQLFFPRPPDPNIADASGLLILQPFNGIPLWIYMIFTTIFGIYLAAITTNYLKNKFLGYAVSLFLILSIPLFLYLFLGLADTLRDYYGYVDSGGVILYQDAVLLSMLLPITQLLAVWIFDNNLRRDKKPV